MRTKQYHGQNFSNIEYSYDANQRLTWRKFWSSPSVNKQTFYSYDDAGNLTSIDYPTSPDVSFTYNEVNQKATMTTAGLGSSTFTYTDAERPASESGLWASDTVRWYYHPSVPGLRTNLTVFSGSIAAGQTLLKAGIIPNSSLMSSGVALVFLGFGVWGIRLDD